MREPHASARKTPRRGSVCLECGAELEGPYCTWCGLKTGLAARPVDALLQDALNDLVLFDTKVWRTVRDLLRVPGEVVRSFLDGRRLRYLGPGRTILISTIVLALATKGFTVGLGLAAALFTFGTVLLNAPGLVEVPPAWVPWVYVATGVPVFALATSAVMRGRLYVEHLVYALYVGSVIWLVFSTESAFLWTYRSLVGEPSLGLLRATGGVSAVTLLVYGLLSFRDFYGLNSLLETLVRFAAVCLLSLMVVWGAAIWIVLVGVLILVGLERAAASGGPVVIVVGLYLVFLVALRALGRHSSASD